MDGLGIDWARPVQAWVTPWDESPFGLDTPAVVTGAILALAALQWLAYSRGEPRQRGTARAARGP